MIFFLLELQSADGNLASRPESRLLSLLQDKCHPCSCKACLPGLDITAFKYLNFENLNKYHAKYSVRH